MKHTIEEVQEALDWITMLAIDDCIFSGESDAKEIVFAKKAKVQELIDKQTPKKPIPYFDGEKCGACEALIIPIYITHLKQSSNYCPNCGRAIDRSKDELR